MGRWQVMHQAAPGAAGVQFQAKVQILPRQHSPDECAKYIILRMGSRGHGLGSLGPSRHLRNSWV
jgi:hypothetical protein